MEHEVKRALGGKKGGKAKLHTHEVTYTRAGNGGYHAKVQRHRGAGPHSEGYSHTEDHVLPDAESMQEHLGQHMGDQPEVGEMDSPAEPQESPQQDPTAQMGAA